MSHKLHNWNISTSGQGADSIQRYNYHVTSNIGGGGNWTRRDSSATRFTDGLRSGRLYPGSINFTSNVPSRAYFGRDLDSIQVPQHFMGGDGGGSDAASEHEPTTQLTANERPVFPEPQFLGSKMPDTTINEQPMFKKSSIPSGSLAQELYRLYTHSEMDSLKSLLTEDSGLIMYVVVKHELRIGDLAAAEDKVKVLETLNEIKYNFSLERNGLTPLHHAVLHEKCESIKFLCNQLGVDPNITFPNGEYLIHKACVFESTEVLRTLLQDCSAKCEYNMTDRSRNTVLHRACLEDSLKHVDLILNYGDEQMVNAVGYEGKTALHIATINQNRAILNRLLLHGAYIDIVSENGSTILDIIVAMESTILMTDVAHYFTKLVTTNVKAKNIGDLTRQQDFERFLGFLGIVDNEFQLCRPPVHSSNVSDNEFSKLFQKLSTDSKVDIIEFSEVLLRLMETDKIHCLLEEKNEPVLRKVAANVVRYVLYKEDAILLQRVSMCGVVWTKLCELIEDRLEQVYVHTPDRGVNGIFSTFKEMFFLTDNDSHNKYDEVKCSLDRQKIAKYYGKFCSNFRMAPCRPDSLNPDVKYMRHPLDTMTMWSIFTGRFKLTELCLQQEKFDVIPLSLYAAAVLRALTNNSSIHMRRDNVLQLAANCELYAKDCIDKIYAVDTSYKRHVTVDYLLQPLISYGDVSCIELAAKNESSSFLQTQAGQQALEKQWFGFLLKMNPVIREVLIWLAAIPGNILVPILLVYFEQKYRRKEKLHGAPPISQDAQNDGCHFMMNKCVNIKDSDKPKSSDNSTDDATLTDETDCVKLDENHLDVPMIKIMKDVNSVPRQHFASLAETDSLISQEHPADHRRRSTLTSRSWWSRYIRLFLHQLYQFYQIPAVKFRYHALSHVILVSIMSYVMLYNMKYKMDMAEIIAYVIIFGFLIEEVHEIILHFANRSMFAYIRSKWNLIDLAALISAMIGIGFRISRLPEFRSSVGVSGYTFISSAYVIEMITKNNGTSEHKHDWHTLEAEFTDVIWYTARIFLGVSTMLFWVRLLYIATVLENLGPKLKMIAKMIAKDMYPFLFILFIFIFGFGVLIHGLLFPNGHSAWNPKRMTLWQVLLGMFKICFYSMVGDYSLDSIMGNDECDLLYKKKMYNENRCPHHLGRYIVPYIVLPMYVIVTELLLLNLIISLFSNTVMEIDACSRDLWQFERHELIEEFTYRSALPPPLNILDMIRKVIKYFLQKCNLIPKCVLGGRHGEAFDQSATLKFLLFQAFSLRNNHQRFMEETEEDTKFQKYREIVHEEMEKFQSSNQPSKNEFSPIPSPVSKVPGSFLSNHPQFF